MDDAAIHRVSGDAGGLSVCLLSASGSPRAFSPRDDKRKVGSVTESQWIATGFALAMTRVVGFVKSEW